ncbi:17614_t:CDS:1, partial [Acaulospora morrowiae]
LKILDVLNDLNIDLIVNEISIPVLNNNTNMIFDELPNFELQETNDIKINDYQETSIGLKKKKRFNLNIPQRTEGMLNQIKKEFYQSLKQYWQFDNELSFVSCLLDLHVKDLGFLTSAQQIKI